MIEAMRARAAEQKIAIAGAAVAKVSDLPDYYIAKLLAPRPTRRIGMLSL
jgi:hypothetical protein